MQQKSLSNKSKDLKGNSKTELLSAAGIGTFDVDSLNGQVELNDVAKTLFGWSHAAVVNFPVLFQYVTPVYKAYLEITLRNCFDSKGDGTFNIELRIYQAKQKHNGWVNINGQAYFDDNGNVIRFCGIIRSIKEKKGEDNIITYPHELARMALEAANVGYYQWIVQTNQIEYSPNYLTILTGDLRQHFHRDDFEKNIHPDDIEIRRAALTEASATGKLSYTIRVYWDDGSMHWIKAIGVFTYDENQNPLTLTGTVQDITSEVEGREQERKLVSLIQGSEEIMWMASLDGRLEFLNDYGRLMLGIKTNNFTTHSIEDIFGRQGIEIYKSVILPALEEKGRWNGVVSLSDLSHKNFIPVHLLISYLKNIDGNPVSIIATARDMRNELAARDNLRQSDVRFRSIVEQAPLAIGVLHGRDMIIESANDKLLEHWQKDASIIGMPILEALPDIKSQPFIGWLQEVYDTGKPFVGIGIKMQSRSRTGPKDIYLDFTYSPLRDLSGKVTSVMMFATNVTAQMLATKQIQESEQRFRSLMEVAPVAIAVFSGDDMVVEMPNQYFLDMVGKGNEITGRPLTAVTNAEELQTMKQVLQNVSATGKMFKADGVQVQQQVDGTTIQKYYNVSFTPLVNAEDKIYAILHIAVDVTDQVIARLKIKEAEESLRGAIELAELGTWTLDLVNQKIMLSERLKEWYGTNGTEDAVEVFKQIIPQDRHRIEEAIRESFTTSVYNAEYRVINKKTGRQRILSAQGKTYFDKNGMPVKMSGTAQDITEQRELQTALEQDVMQRTEDLRQTNEELEKSNLDLIRSNQELSQYAYVASHDLQEPLRKIRIFSDLLKAQVGEDITQNSLLNKITSSAERMSLLIRDLLEFSRLLNADAMFQPVDLNQTLQAIVDDFELTIEEKKAKVVISQLPVINAVGLQMNQLFYNLLSNSLKFSDASKPIVIEVYCKKLSPAEAVEVMPEAKENMSYYNISFKDNGIGFEDQYSEHIFEVFKRLHQKDSYPGSGIGLALCRRIVANHNGYMFAESKPNEGAAFHIIIPDGSYEASTAKR